MVSYALKSQVLRRGSELGRHDDDDMLFGSFSNKWIWLDTVVVDTPALVGGINSTPIYLSQNPVVQAASSPNIGLSAMYSSPGVYRFPDYLTEKGVTPAEPEDWREVVYYLEVIG
jgi:hypothetical protein